MFPARHRRRGRHVNRHAALPRWLAAAAVSAIALAGCSLTYNWRDVRFDDRTAGLAALLPCKPDRAQKTVAFNGADAAVAAATTTTTLAMLGCEAGGVTFTLAHLHIERAANAGAALAQWRAATLARLGGRESQRAPFTLIGALALPGTGMATFEVRNSVGNSGFLQQRAAWFARAGAVGGVELFQAAILGSRMDAAAAETFFSGLRLE